MKIHTLLDRKCFFRIKIFEPTPKILDNTALKIRKFAPKIVIQLHDMAASLELSEPTPKILESVPYYWN